MTPSVILLTGANGFVGRHLMAALKKDFPDHLLLAATSDITDADALTTEIRSATPEFCVHLAGISAVVDAQRTPAKAWQVNLHGTLTLAHALRAHAPQCLLIHASSADAYGGAFRSGESANEATALAPLNTYSATKAAADLALGAMAAQGLRCIRVRPFNHTGPGQSEAFVVASFARQLALIEAGRAPPVISVGNLDPMRDFLDVRDVCDAYAACIARADTLPTGTIFNVASGIPRRIGDVLQELLDISGLRNVVIEADLARMRSTDIPIACGNSAKAEQLLGWKARLPWRQTLTDVLGDWRHRVAVQSFD